MTPKYQEETGQYRPRLKRLQLVTEIESDMAGPARRDLVWDAALRAILSNPASIRLRDVQHLVDEEDVSDRTVRRTMNAMEALGWLEKEKEGGHYWYPGPKSVQFFQLPGREQLEGAPSSNKPTARTETSAQSTNTGGEIERSRTTEDLLEELDVDDAQEASAPDREEPTDAIETAVENAYVPGSGEVERRRRETFRKILTHLREKGQASPAELKEKFYEKGSDGYNTDHSWWKNFVYRALKDCELTDHGGEGSHTWFYVAED